jgi:hypothetical protein
MQQNDLPTPIMRISVICLVILFCAVGVSGQYFSNADFTEEFYVYKVKSIDEFIERFNDDLSSALRHEYSRQNKPFTPSRTKLILSLLNRENKAWATDTSLIAFVTNIVDPAKPKHLFFNDTNWYAQTTCVFTAKGKKIKIPVVLHIKNETNKGIKWMIAGVGSSPVLKDTANITLEYATPFYPNTKYISSASHAVDFVELSNVFSPTMNANYYFDEKTLNNGYIKKFIKLILSNSIAFNYVSEIKYLFFQLPGKIMDVEYYNRANLNSGWLINNITSATESEKETAIKKLLGN